MDYNPSKGFCYFPPFLWATESDLGDFGDAEHTDHGRKWTTETEYRNTGDGWIKSTRLVVWPSRITVKREIDGYCGTGSYRLVEEFDRSLGKRSPGRLSTGDGGGMFRRGGAPRGDNISFAHHRRQHQGKRKMKHRENFTQTSSSKRGNSHHAFPANTADRRGDSDFSSVGRSERQSRSAAKLPCFEREPPYDIICLSEEPNNKYRIRYK